MAKHFYAYGVTNGRATLVRCITREGAKVERDRLKMSDCRTVGAISRAVTESEMTSDCTARGWSVETIR